MKEYRIVCTIDYKHGDGKTKHYDIATPWHNGIPFSSHQNRFLSLKDAKQALKQLAPEIKEADRINNERFEQRPHDYIHRVQSNLRIQAREVTQWKDA